MIGSALYYICCEIVCESKISLLKCMYILHGCTSIYQFNLNYILLRYTWFYYARSVYSRL